MSREAIQVDGLTVAFGDFVAIKDLSLIASYGEVHGVIGPNGAGKTTLLDVITGKSRPRAGHVWLDHDTSLAEMSEHDIARAGVGRKFQKPSIFENLAVYNNLEMAMRDDRSWGRRLVEGITETQDNRIREVLKTIGLEAEASRLAGHLAHGQRQWLEIGMLLMQEPRVLMLDEPVAGMSDEETEQTAELVDRLRSDTRAILVIEHDMDFVERVADRVTVLNEGSTLFEGSMAAARQDPKVIDVYLGR